MIIKAKVLGNICSDHWRKAQAAWFQNMLSILLIIVLTYWSWDKWCQAPFSVCIEVEGINGAKGINGARPHFVTENGAWHHLFGNSHRQARDEKKGTGYFFSKKEKVSTHGQNNRKSSLFPFSPSMSEQRELRSRREEQMENGVKNLKGSEAICQNLLVAF